MTGDWPSIPALVRSAAAAHPGREAVIDGETSLSYPVLFEQAQRFAGAVVSSGLAPGDRVGIWAYNSAEWIVAALGLWQAGCVLVPVNTRFKGGEAADILGRSGVRLLVTVTDFLGTDYVELLRGADLPALETIVVAAGSVPEGTESWVSFMARATAEAVSEAERRAAALVPEDPSDILFTSGTTGRPKGVVQTHGRTLRVGTDWVAMTGLQADDRYLMVNPYFHMFGLKAGILASIAAGATMLPQAVFDVDAVLTRVQREKVTVLPGAPTLYQSILDHPGLTGYDLSTLRVAVTGAADIPVELIRRVRDELPFSLVVTGYGLTEAGTATATSPEDDATTVATTVGRPRPGFELRIADDKGRDVASGAAGEILLRGGSVMLHYLDDLEATEAALTVDGWLRTGDLGTVDDRGFLHIVGRSKEMFIVGGFNVYPAEVENFLLEHPGVARAAVIGIPDRRMGEVGIAFVVPRPGAAVEASDVVEWARGRMANYKVPRLIEIVDELPLNATGKVQKDVLRRRAATARPRRGP
ncbi:MAG TPA: FadD3 family acyl-CoA ligase [Acidimicrobiales bacterium]|nr:FadD3 family acyl-CoA ligase [Acidimicrobiales bacterium]